MMGGLLENFFLASIPKCQVEPADVVWMTLVLSSSLVPMMSPK
jgi:hypothetical protein